MIKLGLFLLALVALAVSGCSITAMNLPVANPSDRVFAIKDSKRERIRAGNVLFVNRSLVWRENLAFDGGFSEEQLIGIGPDGFPMLMAEPIGRFDIGPADRGSYGGYDEDTGANRKLVKFLWPGQEYTLLVVSKDMMGGVVAPFQVIHGRVSTQPMNERYYYRLWLGPGAGQMTYDIVNDVEILPNVYVGEYRGTNYLFDKTIDLNQLLRRGIHRVR